MTQYAFDNAWQQGRERLNSAEEFLDPGTIHHLEALGVTSGWQCLEAGAGGGSIAQWLCRRVGPDGHVVATDIDTRFLDVLDEPNLEVRRHDLVRDELSENVFDLVHTRLVLEHLPNRGEALQKLVRSLKPGGWLLIEAVDYASGVPVSAHGAREHEHTQAVRLRLMSAAGLDPNLGRALPGTLKAQGLVDVNAEGRAFVMQGGSAGARWFRLSMEQLRGTLIGPGKLEAHEVDRMIELFEDPDWAAMSPLIMAVWGRSSAGLP